MEYDNTNRFALFKNDKGDNPKRPDSKGSGTFQCPHCQAKSEFTLSGWNQEKRDGSGKYISGKAEPKEQPHQPRQAPAPTPHQRAKQDAYQPQDDEDDIPF